VIHRQASTGEFDLATYEPGEALRPFVDHYWAVRWDRHGRPPWVSETIPFPAVHLSVESGDPGEVRHGVPMPATLIHGVVMRRFVIELTGSGRVLGVKFRPGGFWAWARVPVDGYTDRAGPVGGLCRGELARAGDQVLATEADEDRVAVLDTVLVRHAPEPSDSALRLIALVDAMREDPALIRVEQLPERCGWTVRTIQRLFRRYVGASPKWVLARYRLQEAALAIDADPAADLAELAHSLGWYDQAHFTNDFREMLGVTPGEYAMRAAGR
jgi:AraC-like DNA-binding protein